jgi:hypothetical protein
MSLRKVPDDVGFTVILPARLEQLSMRDHYHRVKTNAALGGGFLAA